MMVITNIIVLIGAILINSTPPARFPRGEIEADEHRTPPNP